jgi:prophage regulatory protein
MNKLAQSYRAKEAALLLGIGVTTLWRWAKERPDFPKPLRLSQKVTVFPGDKLIEWRDAQSAPLRSPRGRKPARQTSAIATV